jgi:hypothetical protein
LGDKDLLSPILSKPLTVIALSTKTNYKYETPSTQDQKRFLFADDIGVMSFGKWAV